MRGGDSLVEKAKNLYGKVKDAAPVIHKIIDNSTVRDLAAKVMPGGKDKSSGRDILVKISKFMDVVGLKGEGSPEVMRRVGASKQFKDWCKEEEREHGGRIGMGGTVADFVTEMEKKASKGGRIGMAMAEKCGGRFHSMTDKNKLRFAKSMGLVKRGTGLMEMGQQVIKAAVDAVTFLFNNKEKIKELLGSPLVNKTAKKALDAVGAKNIPDQPTTWLKEKMESVGLGKAKEAVKEEMLSRENTMRKARGKGKGEKEEMLSRSDAMRRAKEAEKEEMLSRSDAMRRAKEAEKEGMLSRAATMRKARGKGKGDEAYLAGGVGRDSWEQFWGPNYPSNGYTAQARLNNLALDSAQGWNGDQDKNKPTHQPLAVTTHKVGGRAEKPTGGRKPSAYALFVKEYSQKHPGLGKSLMKEAAAAWKKR
jgi:hypothetical protein